jgi:basic membrane protein A
VHTRTVEPADGSDRESAVRHLAASGVQLVITVGFIFSDDLRLAAKHFPQVKFVAIDFVQRPDQPPPPPNLLGVRFREQEGAFLVGAIAANVSKQRKIGFVGGMEIPIIRKFQLGFQAGVKQECPQCEIFAAYAGSEPTAFADPTKGKELALAQYARGADIIFHAAGKTGIGVFNAARAQKKLAIGVDADQYHEAPCCVLTSMLKKVDVAVREAIHDLVQGRFKGGLREMGLAQDGVDYVYDEHNRRWISEAARLRVEALRQAIIADKIKVPYE